MVFRHAVPASVLPEFLGLPAFVEARVVLIRAGFEAPVHPKILVRGAPHFPLDSLVDQCGILKFIAAGKVFKGRVEVNVITRTILTPEMTERNHLAATALRDPGCCGNRARRYSEKWCKDNILAAIILIGGIPDGPV